MGNRSLQYSYSGKAIWYRQTLDDMLNCSVPGRMQYQALIDSEMLTQHTKIGFHFHTKKFTLVYVYFWPKARSIFILFMLF